MGITLLENIKDPFKICFKFAFVIAVSLFVAVLFHLPISHFYVVFYTFPCFICLFFMLENVSTYAFDFPNF